MVPCLIAIYTTRLALIDIVKSEVFFSGAGLLDCLAKRTFLYAAAIQDTGLIEVDVTLSESRASQLPISIKGGGTRATQITYGADLSV